MYTHVLTETIENSVATGFGSFFGYGGVFLNPARIPYVADTSSGTVFNLFLSAQAGGTIGVDRWPSYFECFCGFHFKNFAAVQSVVTLDNLQFAVDEVKDITIEDVIGDFGLFGSISQISDTIRTPKKMTNVKLIGDVSIQRFFAYLLGLRWTGDGAKDRKTIYMRDATECTELFDGVTDVTGYGLDWQYAAFDLRSLKNIVGSLHTAVITNSATFASKTLNIAGGNGNAAVPSGSTLEAQVQALSGAGWTVSYQLIMTAPLTVSSGKLMVLHGHPDSSPYLVKVSPGSRVWTGHASTRKNLTIRLMQLQRFIEVGGSPAAVTVAT